MPKTRLVLADDHPIVLAGIRMLIDASADLEVVGESASGDRALELILALKPEIAILDISLPVLNGIAVARQATRQLPHLGAIVLTSHDERLYLHQALDAGARGYVLKSSAAECLIRAVKGVAVGGLYVDPSLAHLVSDSPQRRPDAAPGKAALTPRESEVLKLVAAGLTNKEIAGRLDLSSSSVETYRARALTKLGLTTRADIVRYAATRGWSSV